MIEIPEEEMIVETRDYLVSEHIFNPRATVEQIADFIKSEKSTANLRVTYNQGGKRRAVAEERTELSDKESNEVRRVVGMDYEVEVTEDEPKVVNA